MKMYEIVAYAEEGLPRQEIVVLARSTEDAYTKGWKFFPEYHEIGVFEKEGK